MLFLLYEMQITGGVFCNLAGRKICHLSIRKFRKFSASGDGRINTCQIPRDLGSIKELIQTGLMIFNGKEDHSSSNNLQKLQVLITLFLKKKTMFPTHIPTTKIADSDRA